jgi:hypothetical protein
MRKIDEQYTACPFYGSRRMTVWLTNQGEEVNRKGCSRASATVFGGNWAGSGRGAA